MVSCTSQPLIKLESMVHVLDILTIQCSLVFSINLSLYICSDVALSYLLSWDVSFRYQLCLRPLIGYFYIFGKQHFWEIIVIERRPKWNLLGFVSRRLTILSLFSLYKASGVFFVVVFFFPFFFGCPFSLSVI